MNANDLVFLPATDIARLIREKHVSALEVVNCFLQQIDRHNAQVNAIVTLDDDCARERAKEADTAIARGEIWGPLHGIPITVKDALETAGLQTTSSYKPLAGHIPTQDATAVARLRSAGAIILGKTNLPQLADGPQTNSPLFGRTNNPWNLDCTPGGSSGGSAAALAAGFSALEIGSDIGGSVRLPAHFCGVFSIKPTDYLVSTAGHIPPLPPMRFRGLLQYLLSVGSLARSVADLRLALSLIAGPDARAWQIPPVSLACSPRRPLHDLRIAWTDDLKGFSVTEDTRTALRRLVVRLVHAGCIVERCTPPDFDIRAAVETNYEIQMAAFTAHQTPLNIPRWGLRWLGQRIDATQPVLRGALFGAGATLKHYGAALTRREAFICALEKFLAKWDAWLCPVAPMPAFVHTKDRNLLERVRASVNVDGEYVSYLDAANVFTSIFNLTGSPVVVLPIAQSREGLPIGIQIAGRRWHDMELLNIADTLTEITGDFHRPPGF